MQEGVSIFRGWAGPGRSRAMLAPPSVHIAIDDAPFEAPVKRKLVKLRTVPKTSCSKTASTRPVAGSGRRISSRVPREMHISCVFGRPEKAPATEAEMEDGGASERL